MSKSRPISGVRVSVSRSRSARGKPPLALNQLTEKIGVLDEFQYKSRFGPTDTKAVLNLLETKQSCVMHVTDLWSKQQHKSFLKALKAVDAQKVRERLERERVTNASVEQVPGHTLDEMYERLMVYNEPQQAVRNYALGRPGLIQQEISAGLRISSSVHTLNRHSASCTQLTSRNTLLLDSLIHKCDRFESRYSDTQREVVGPMELLRRKARRKMHLRRVLA